MIPLTITAIKYILGLTTKVRDKNIMGTLDQATAELHSEIWQWLQKLPQDQRWAVELAGLKAMRDRIAQRVRCTTEGEGCEAEPTIAGISEGWLR